MSPFSLPLIYTSVKLTGMNLMLLKLLVGEVVLAVSRFVLKQLRLKGWKLFNLFLLLADKIK